MSRFESWPKSGNRLRLGFGSVDSGLDIVVCPLDRMQTGEAGVRILAEVKSPFARLEGIYETLEANPQTGDALISEAVASTKTDLTKAVSSGVDGIFYVLAGANPTDSTPMQYGGHFLEVDRDLLTVASESLPTAIYLQGADVYFDFVCDLPGDAMGWNASKNEIDLQSAKAICSKPFFTQESHADIEFVPAQPAWAKPQEVCL